MQPFLDFSRLVGYENEFSCAARELYNFEIRDGSWMDIGRSKFPMRIVKFYLEQVDLAMVESAGRGRSLDAAL